MAETETLIRWLESGPIHELEALLDAEPRRMNTFLTQPAGHGDEQWMPMHFAARAGHVEAAEALLRRGVHPDCRTRFRTPMHARQTPLHLAAQHGHAEVIERLIDHADAEIEVRDAQLRSPLWLAARHGHLRATGALTRRGADLEARDAQGRSPLHAALLPPDNESPWGEARCETANMFKVLGADLDAVCPREPEGYTPLHRCVALGELGDAPHFLEQLLRAGADATLADPRFGRTARELAVQLGHTEMVAVFDNHAADHETN